MFNKGYEKNLVVEGMHCEHCSKKVKDTILKIENVKKVDVNLKSGEVKIISKSELDDNLLKEKIEELGYKVK